MPRQALDRIKIPLIDVQEVGRVKEVRRGIAKVDGLPSCIYGQMVEFTGGTKGMVMGFNSNDVLVIVLGAEGNISIGDSATTLTELLNIPVGEAFVGRIVNSIGEPIDGKGEIKSSANMPIFKEAPGVMEREPISEALLTGIKTIDLNIPIGKGQREL
ncbi:MAG: F0F1 ATP synthase subunit alpha, partial [Candidatus Omnitrophica bacterium]|nr:F0F1 ATP synthase subunit alpha [Candidatus Omnitrophota bacterium]